MLELRVATPTNENRLNSFGIALGDAYHATIQKIKTIGTSPLGQFIIGIGLGLSLWRIYDPLITRIFQVFGHSLLPDPFRALGVGTQILLTPLIVLFGPILEEFAFRELLQGYIKQKLILFYTHLGFSEYASSIAARVTSVFFTSVLFGLVHFANCCLGYHPMVFLPQVIVAIITGITLSLAREVSGGLWMPIGMHVGNNALAWRAILQASMIRNQVLSPSI